jgi:hypothetical protein
MKQNPKRKRIPQDQAHKKSLTWNWQASIEGHTLCAEQFCFSRQGITDRDIIQFAQHGDIVTQCYLNMLYKTIPKEAESKRPLVGLYVERLLIEHIRSLNEMLCDLAVAGRWSACEELWVQALKLSETFCSLALKNPAPFKAKAWEALFMPSVRAKNPKFSYDAQAIADAIEFGKKSVSGNLTDNRTRLGALCPD